MRREYGQDQSPSYKDDPPYKSGYAAGYKISSQGASRVPTASELGTASKQALAEDTTISVSTIASYGPTNYAPIKWALSEGAALVLGDSAPEIPVATSSGALTITLASGELSAGLKIEGCKLTGAVASVSVYRFTLRAVQAFPGGGIVDERTFANAGVRAAAGYAGLPDTVQVSSEGALSAANNPMIPRNLFSAPGSLAARTILVWETVACGPPTEPTSQRLCLGRPASRTCASGRTLTARTSALRA